MTVSCIEQLEERLRQAMLAGDITVLNELISDRLQFVTPDGANVGKAADLEAHRCGSIRIYTLTPLAQHIEPFVGTAIVNVEMDMSGSFAGAAFSGRFRYTRVWHQEGGRIQVIAGHVSAIKQDPTPPP